MKWIKLQDRKPKAGMKVLAKYRKARKGGRIYTYACWDPERGGFFDLKGNPVDASHWSPPTRQVGDNVWNWRFIHNP